MILDPKRIPGLDDSKRLTAEQPRGPFRDYPQALAVSFASCSAETIDRTDIHQASLEAMRRSAHSLALAPAFAITDGLDVPAGLPCPGEAFVKGDQRSYSIAAASIVAKVMRDRMMGVCGSRHSAYGFEFHMGYATERHRAAIRSRVPARGCTGWASPVPPGGGSTGSVGSRTQRMKKSRLWGGFEFALMQSDQFSLLSTAFSRSANRSAPALASPWLQARRALPRSRRRRR